MWVTAYCPQTPVRNPCLFMQLSQKLRRFGSSIRKLFRFTPSHEPEVQVERPASAASDGKAKKNWKLHTAIGVLVFLVLLWPALAVLKSHIDDDPDFSPPTVKGGSHSVAMAVGLIEREVNQAGWVANAPFFMPAAMLNNMPNYQIGMVGALGRFSFELEDQIGRERGSSAADPDLTEARSLLQYEPTVWIFKPGTIWPTAPAEQQYRDAAKALKRYNVRVANGEATFDARSDNLMAVLDRIALDLGAMSAELDTAIDHRHKTLGLLDLKADKVFYRVKGASYTYYMLLKAMEPDFQQALENKQVKPIYDQMLAELKKAALMLPLVVNNGSLSGQVFPNHLANQGFHLLRARTKMREITDILRK